MKIHAIASLPHYRAHVEAVWKHLPHDMKGEFRFGKREKAKGWPEQDIVMLAGFYDIDRVPNNRIIYVEHGAGQSYCLTPNTRVLKANLTWTPLSEIAVGDELVAFEDERRKGTWRAWQQSTVLSVQWLKQPCYELLMADGTTVTSSAEHRWLTRDRQTFEWSTTAALQPANVYPQRSSKLIKPFSVWDEDHSWGGGYLAAAFDGEGCFTQTPRVGRQGRMMLAFSQRENQMAVEVRRLMAERGFDFKAQGRATGSNADVSQYAVKGGTAEVCRFLGSIRPRRLLGNMKPLTGGQFRGKPVELLEKRYVGEQVVVGLMTSTGTFIAEGYASHNSGDGRARSHPAYHNGRHPARVIGYISPRQDVADAWGRPAVAVGCPIVDDVEDHRLLETPTAVLAFHWDAYRVCPEASTAYDHYAESLLDMAKHLQNAGFCVLGHCHPRDTMGWFRWNHLGVKTVTVDHVRSNADLLIADNTSLMYEMLHLGRGVISLNSPIYRRHVDHGLRFWDWAPGRQVDEPEEFLAFTGQDFLNACGWTPWSAEVSKYVYGRQLSDGLAGKRAADWIAEYVGSL